MLSLLALTKRIGNVGGSDQPFIGKLEVINAPFLGRGGFDTSRHNSDGRQRSLRIEMSTSEPLGCMYITSHPLTITGTVPNS